LKGRWQKIGENPAVIVDTAHNAEGLLEIINQIHQTPHKKLRWVFGMVKDKLPEKVLSILPKEAEYYFCQAKIPRALDSAKLGTMAFSKGLTGKVVADVNDALRLAKKESSPDDLIMVGGSTFVVAEVDEL
jgi:dihydrofolate synthase/folylpolyglutamate synthase